MYVNPFWLGVVGTLVVEIMAVFVGTAITVWRNDKK